MKIVLYCTKCLVCLQLLFAFSGMGNNTIQYPTRNLHYNLQHLGKMEEAY